MNDWSSNEVMEKELKLLEAIREVPVNPFLFQKIKRSIEQRKKETLSISLTWGIAACMLLLVLLNITLILQHQDKQRNNLVVAFSLTSQNELYHE